MSRCRVGRVRKVGADDDVQRLSLSQTVGVLVSSAPIDCNINIEPSPSQVDDNDIDGNAVWSKHKCTECFARGTCSNVAFSSDRFMADQPLHVTGKQLARDFDLHHQE